MKSIVKVGILIVSICAIICAVLISVRSCRHRQYIDKEDQTDPAEMILTATNEVGGYRAPVIKKSGDQSFYQNMTVEELEKIFYNSSHDIFENPLITTTGAMYGVSRYVGDYRMYNYNRLTGNISAWCSDPLCSHEGEECVWSTADILYVGKKNIYFESQYDGNMKLYSCDMQRNNIKAIYDIPEYRVPSKTHEGQFNEWSDTFTILHEHENKLYIQYYEYKEFDAATLSVCSLNCETLEWKKEFDLPSDVTIYAGIGDKFYYRDSQKGTIWQADLSFENKEAFLEGSSIHCFTDKYMVIGDYVSVTYATDPVYIYNIQTGEKTQLDDSISKCFISGDYLYYTRILTDEEMENDPLKDYYTWTWTIGRKTMTTGTRSAGKVYRLRIGDSQPECVLQLTYEGIPVRIKNMVVDGEVVYFSFHNYKEFKNYYNQDYSDRNDGALHYAVADLQNGTVTFLEFPE